MYIDKKKVSKKGILFTCNSLLILIFIKFYIFLYLILSFSKYNNINKLSNFVFNGQYIEIQKKINMSFHNKFHNKNKIKIAIYTHCIKNGGRARVTALFLQYLYKIKIFDLFLFTSRFKEDNEYIIPENIKRVIIKNDIIKYIKKNKIDVFIYELDEIKEISFLNKFKDSKVIFYHHSSTLDWLYKNYTFFKAIYQSFLDSKYIVSIVPFESYYLFKKWGIKSIFMDNFITYDFNSVIQTDLTSKIMIMLGRAYAKKKRFLLGIQSMEYIVKEIPECVLKIISNHIGINKQQYFIENINLENNIKFIGYIASPDIFFKNVSLSIFPSLSEAFPMVLVETKIYGIPNILMGLDYIANLKGGTFIIYDDTPESLAKEAIYILTNKKDQKRLSLSARNSIKKFNNNLLLLKWIKLILSVYNNDDYCCRKLRDEDKKINEKEAVKIIENQVKLIKKRDKKFLNISFKNFENFTWMKQIEQKTL